MTTDAYEEYFIPTERERELEAEILPILHRMQDAREDSAQWRFCMRQLRGIWQYEGAQEVLEYYRHHVSADHRPDTDPAELGSPRVLQLRRRARRSGSRS